LKYRALNNGPDFRVDGLWVKSSTCLETRIQTRTRAYNVWMSMESRKRHSMNGFESFQHFADWCQPQPGYLEKDSNGRFWALDKDWTIFGNRVYSPSTCIFLPGKVNSWANFQSSYKSGLPIGVSYCDSEIYRKSKFYHTTVTGVDGTHYSGRFHTAIEAHFWWMTTKAYETEKLISVYSNFPHIAEVLENYLCVLNKHLSIGKELPKDKGAWTNNC